MEMAERIQFESNSFGKRIKSMLKVDFRRMFTTPLFYIMVGVCLVIPILILVMTTMMDLSLTGMCNINMLYFFAAVFVCIFIAADFRSGYAKNLFAVRSKKSDYVVSKTLAGFVGGVFLLLAFFVGTMVGGAIAGLPFDTGAAGVSGIVMCMLSKMFLVAVFVPIYVLMSVVGKQKLWLSLLGSLCVGMLFFNIVPMMTPLDSTMVNVVLCLAGGALFSVGLGAVSNIVLKKTSLV